jgi:hypothetical protein
MKYVSAIFLILLIVLSACAVNSPKSLDKASIQNTAIAIALTTISQTQAVGLVSTINAQGTQLSRLTQAIPTFAITPTFLATMVNDENIKVAVLRLLGWNDTNIVFNTEYNDGWLAIGYYNSKGTIPFVNGSWIAQKVGSGSWGIVYISKGIPPCKELQKFNLNDSQPPGQCLDSNGNVMIRWQWRGQ